MTMRGDRRHRKWAAFLVTGVIWVCGATAVKAGDWQAVTELRPGQLIDLERTGGQPTYFSGKLIAVDEAGVLVQTLDGDVRVAKSDIRSLGISRQGREKYKWIGSTLAAGGALTAMVLLCCTHAFEKEDPGVHPAFREDFNSAFKKFLPLPVGFAIGIPLYRYGRNTKSKVVYTAPAGSLHSGPARTRPVAPEIPKPAWSTTANGYARWASWYLPPGGGNSAKARSRTRGVALIVAGLGSAAAGGFLMANSGRDVRVSGCADAAGTGWCAPYDFTVWDHRGAKLAGGIVLTGAGAGLVVVGVRSLR